MFSFFFDFIKTSLFQITCTLMKYLHNHKNQSFKYLRFSNIIQNFKKISFPKISCDFVYPIISYSHIYVMPSQKKFTRKISPRLWCRIHLHNKQFN